mmetsp:Transcript_1043/g.2737  ORF Transcript_1043/g.2737 Transcript_1043/m.2737 type:complete len:227 (+) Transcript_1043:1417-2097(+)
MALQRARKPGQASAHACHRRCQHQPRLSNPSRVQAASSTRSRPSCLARYSATSARLNRASGGSPAPRARATPTLAVTFSGPAAVWKGRDAMASRSRSPRRCSASASACGQTTANSSPPRRTARSTGRSVSRRRSPMPLSTASPTAWPKLSLMRLKWSTSSSASTGACAAPRCSTRRMRSSKPRRFSRPVSTSTSIRRRICRSAWSWISSTSAKACTIISVIAISSQ